MDLDSTRIVLDEVAKYMADELIKRTLRRGKPEEVGETLESTKYSAHG